MPELPEVQTTASGLDKVLRGLSIKDVWTDYNSKYFYGSDNIKDPKFFIYFKKNIEGAKILEVSRRAKNILIHLSNEKTVLIHMKMTGHVMYGDYDRDDPFNRFIRMILHLSNGKTVELCDTRKFAKVTLVETKTMHISPHLKDLGPEPLEKTFTFSVFKECLTKRPEAKIKTALLDQSLIAGIGNIYSDESLWRSSIHPEEKVCVLLKKQNEKKLKGLYKNIRNVLKKGIDLGGDSMSDYRNIEGKRGKFQEQHRAYRKTGTECSKKGCEGIIKRIIVSGRGTHFCPVHQRRL